MREYNRGSSNIGRGSLGKPAAAAAGTGASGWYVRGHSASEGSGQFAWLAVIIRMAACDAG